MRASLHFLAALSSAALLTFVSADFSAAQSIEVGELGAAQDFDAGVQIDGALDPALWQNTSAKMAAHLLRKAPINSKDPLVHALVRSVVLTGGVPPEGANDAYNKARLRAVMALSEPEALKALTSRSPELMSRTDMRAEAALAVGDTKGACNLTDSVTQGRSEPFWARLRAFCHVTRGEIAAAELTANLLKKSGYEDPDYFSLLSVLTGASDTAGDIDLSSDPLYGAMAAAGQGATLNVMLTPTKAKAIALNPEADPKDRLDALFISADILDDAAIEQVLSGILYDKLDGTGLQNLASFSYEGALKAEPAQSFSQLFTVLRQDRSAIAASAFLKRADNAGAFKRFSELIKTDLIIIPAEDRAQTDLPIFTRAAILQGELGELQSYFRAIPEGPKKLRIALASDALGNGFQLGAIGLDIEGRLTAEPAKRERARRDALLAVALGANLSENAALALEGQGDSAGRTIKSGDIAGLRAAAKDGSRAETALRAAILLEGKRLNDQSFADVISALMEAGLTEQAGKFAARDFLADL